MSRNKYWNIRNELRKQLEDDAKINEFVKEVTFVDGNEKMDGKDVATEKTEQMKKRTRIRFRKRRGYRAKNKSWWS